MALYYPIELPEGTEYGNACVSFKAKTYIAPQASNGGGNGANGAAPNIIPLDAASGSLFNVPNFQFLEGVVNPVNTFIPPNLTEKYKGSKLGGITKASETVNAEILLYMPGDVGIGYQAKWEEQNSPIAAQAIQGLRNVYNNPSVDTAAAAIGNSAGALTADMFMNTIPGGDIISQQSGHAPNPKKQLIFKDMEFRKFQFTYNFYAKSEKEAKAIREIIFAFKKAMHPGTDHADFLYDYPDTFEIKYLVNQNNNPYLHKFKQAILEDIQIKYAPEGLFVSHEDGSPTHTIMTLSFREIEVILKKDFVSPEDSV